MPVRQIRKSGIRPPCLTESSSQLIMTGIALPPVKGDVRPLYCYTSCGFALQGLMLPRTVSREGNLSDFQASKEASSPSNLFYVDSMCGVKSAVVYFDSMWAQGGGLIAHQRKSTIRTDFHRVTDKRRWDNIFSQSVSLTQYLVLSICLYVRLFQLAS